MAVESNGKLAEPGKKAMNGYTKAPRSKLVKKTKGGFSIFSTISRLFTWYTIITILLRCPAAEDLLTDTSPKICKPYFQLRSVVAPHLEPYYDEYAAPYVDAARPYYNTFDRTVITPVVTLGKKYGTPRVQQAQAFGQAQWQKNIQPQVSKYQELFKHKYDATLGPHITTAVGATSPYYEIAKTSALQTYYEHLLPTYTTIQPYVSQGYDVTSAFAVGTALPFTKWAWTTATVFLDRTVWPKVRILYGENVEPQLVRIGERLGRYRDGKKLQAVIDEVDSFSATSLISETSSSLSSSIAAASTTTQPTTATPSTIVESTEAPAATPQSEQEIREKAQKIVAHDLKTWQEKFAKAADEGSDDLEERITEITDRLIQNQAQKVGGALIIQLEETVKSSLTGLKSSIISIVKDSKNVEESEEILGAAVRKAGVAIKEKAQAVRQWRQNYDRETNSLVSKSSEDTFEILDHIRDLGLQEIGMRWAWTDGITHKDWSKYHQLKTKFDEWRYDVEKVVTEHPGLEKARAASEEVESQAMAIAEDAAKELARLKETGRWKISAGDSTDDFSTKYVPAAAAAAGQKVMEKIGDAMSPSSQSAVGSVVSVASSSLEEGASSASSMASEVSASISSLSDKASSSIAGTPQGIVESIGSVAKGSAGSIVDQASSSIVGTPQGSVESIISEATKTASSLSAKASSSIIGKEPGVVERATESVKSAGSVVSESASSLSDVASSSIFSASTELSSSASQALSSYSSFTESISESVSKSASEASSSINSAASSASSTASKKVFGGAMAQHVEAKQIIFEDIIEDNDDETYSEKLQSMASEAGDRYSEITKAVSEALIATNTAPAAGITKLAADKYSQALSAASVALYGTEQGTGESVSSLVSSRYADAVSAASAIIYGTPMPLTDSIAAQATSVYSDALSRAKQQYTHARSLVSAQISGEPKPIHEEMFSSVENAYSEFVGAASSRYQSALSTASTAAYGTPTPAYQSAFESMSSIAQSRLSEGLSAASAQYRDAKSYVAAVNTATPAKQKLLAQMQEQYYAGVGMAHARYSEFLEAASSAVMPAPTPFLSKASASILGTPTHKFQAALNTASKHYSQAMESASSQLDQVLASISKIGGAHKDVVPTASLADIASSRYSAAVAEASISYVSIHSVVTQKLQAAASAASSVMIGSESPWTASVVSAASSAIIGSETPWTESVASAANENWEALITKASSQIYGAPTPYFVTRRLLSEAREYAAQATDVVGSQYAQVTDGAAVQYSAVQSLISELVSGKEPAFTESVYNRLSAAYFTGAGQVVSSASSYASEAYASASSVVSSVFTPPATLEVILDNAASRVNEAVDAASIQLYGTQKGSYEQAVSSANSAYSSMSSVVSEQVYGSSTGYVEAAQSSIADAVSSAQKALSDALYGTPTGTYESVTNAAGKSYASATSVIAENMSHATSIAGEQYSSAHAIVSEALYGPEKGALESAQSRLSAAVESARVKLAEYAERAGQGATDAVFSASEGVEDFASSVSSVIASATAKAKDEL